MTSVESGVAVSIVGSILACITALWGSKKDRQVGEQAAAKLSLEAAEKVSKDMEANMEKQMTRLNEELSRYRDDYLVLRKQFDEESRKWNQERIDFLTAREQERREFLEARAAERIQFVEAKAEFEKRALTAEGKLLAMEEKVVRLEAFLPVKNPAA